MLRVASLKQLRSYQTATHTPVNVSNVSAQVIAVNYSRKYLLLVNDSDTDIYINIGATAVVNEGIRLNAHGGNYEMSEKLGNLSTAAVNSICAVAGPKILLATEGT